VAVCEVLISEKMAGNGLIILVFKPEFTRGDLNILSIPNTLGYRQPEGCVSPDATSILPILERG
jgi:hypothetical protein